MAVEWNYGYCEGNKEARVSFQNSDSADVQSVISKSPPIKWGTEIIPGQSAPFGGKGQCSTLYDVTINYLECINCGSNCGTPTNKRNRTTTKRVTGPVQDVYWTANTDPNDRKVTLYIKANNQLTIVNGGSGGVCLSINNPNFYDIYSVTIVRVDGQPDNCAPPAQDQCKFTVRDNSGIIYTQTTASCPVNVTASCGKQCPPNTCECRHGNKVCCYDSNGIPVLSFDA